VQPNQTPNELAAIAIPLERPRDEVRQRLMLAASQTRTNPVKIAFAAIMASQPAPADA
jgi:hypothetical protein